MGSGSLSAYFSLKSLASLNRHSRERGCHKSQPPPTVIPAQAGIHIVRCLVILKCTCCLPVAQALEQPLHFKLIGWMDPRFRGDDENKVHMFTVGQLRIVTLKPFLLCRLQFSKHISDLLKSALTGRDRIKRQCLLSKRQVTRQSRFNNQRLNINMCLIQCSALYW